MNPHHTFPIIQTMLILGAALLPAQAGNAQLNNTESAAARTENAHLEDGVALQGHDPVSYHQDGGPAKGNAAIAYEHRGLTYHFRTEENREIFTRDPGKYDVAYGGWCGYMMSQGKQVEPDPENYKLVNGKLVVFFDGFFGDGKKSWEKEARKNGEDKLVRSANGHWVDFLR